MKSEYTERQLLDMSRTERKQHQLAEKALKELVHDPDEYAFYSINVTPKEQLLHDKKIFFVKEKKHNLAKREQYLNQIFIRLHQRMNRHIYNNFKRKPHTQIKHQVIIEHFDHYTKQLIKPHIHGTLAVPAAYNDKFLELLKETSKDIFEIKLDDLNSDFSAIKSTYLKRIRDRENFNRWISYATKQQLEGSKYEDQKGILLA